MRCWRSLYRAGSRGAAMLSFLLAGYAVASESRSKCSPPEIALRDAQIIGRSQRIAPLPIERMSPSTRAEVEAFRTANDSLTSSPVAHGDVPTMIGTMLHHPDLWRQHTAMAQELFRGTLPARDRELAILTVAWLWRAPLEWGEHISIAERAGVTKAEIDRVKAGSSAAGWTGHDRALIGAVEELHADGMIADATWAVLASSYDEKQLIELPILVGQYTMVAFYQNSLRLAPRSGNAGLCGR